jgi:hypothetical protein
VFRYVVDWRARLARLGAAAMTSSGTPEVIGHAGRFPNVLIQAVEYPMRLIGGAGARLLFLSQHSSELNPIELAFTKLKELLRKAQARTVDALWDLIDRTLKLFTPEECADYVCHC